MDGVAYEDFTDPIRHGRKRAILEAIERRRSQMDCMIQFSVADSELKYLLTSMLYDSYTFAGAFIRDIFEYFYKDMVRYCGETKAWELTKSVAADVLDDLAVARSLCGSDSGQWNYAWGAILCHQKAREYMKVGFRDHPKIVARQMRFLLENTSLALSEKADQLGTGCGDQNDKDDESENSVDGEDGTTEEE